MIRGEADDSQVIQVGKRFGIVIAIVAMVVAPMLLVTAFLAISKK